MMDDKKDDARQKGLENLVLLVLGAKDDELSVLHLEKEVFLLWNFHPAIREYISYIKHYKGPYSADIQKIIHHPFYLDNCWKYTPPARTDNLSGGFVELTEKGRNEYQRIYRAISKTESVKPLLTGIKMVRELYDKLSLEELLLIIYDTYPEYKEHSTVSRDIEVKKEYLAKRMRTKGIIDDQRFNELVMR